MTKMTLDQVLDDMDKTFPENTPEQINKMTLTKTEMDRLHYAVRVFLREFKGTLDAPTFKEYKELLNKLSN